jgi:cytochrome bd-type quinol oxidase subunit 2
MGGLLLFIGLWAGALILAWRLYLGLGSLAAVGIGGGDENLETARRTVRLAGLQTAGLLALGALIILTGERWAAAWRATSTGSAVLTVLVFVASGLSLWAFRRSVRQQWSADGSWRGLILAGLGFALSVGLLCLAIYWRGA